MAKARSVYFNAVRCVGGALAISALLLSGATAQGQAITPQDRAAAYRDAVKCFVVAGVFSGDYGEKHDLPMAGMYEGAAHNAYDIAFKLGAALGYTKQRINRDIELTETKEMPVMASNAHYKQDAADRCETLGLM